MFAKIYTLPTEQASRAITQPEPLVLINADFK